MSGESTLSLYSAAGEMVRSSSMAPEIFIWGGISTPEAAAAFLSTGATGIVFESLHWLTDLSVIDDLQRQRIANLRLDSTDLVGLDLQVPCRLFNKGNSRAFKEIKDLEDSICAKEISKESRRSFFDYVHAKAIHPLESNYDPDEVIPLGVEAAFAQSFVMRFGTGTQEAVKAFIAEIRNSWALAQAKKDCFLDSPVAGEIGIQYPFIQGAMSSITDVPEFAVRVADAGGLPTIALGLMDEETLYKKLGRLTEILGARPYAVNIVSLAENPFRDTQLAWIKKHKPRFVWIAGGDLSPIRELMECGIEVIYIAPDEALMRHAFEAGVRYVVCEGYEAGGHVGQHSVLTLAQMVLNLKALNPSLFRNRRVILAGGIFNRETAFMAAMLGADAIQMGTAYLATHEIVETGALSELYQRLILESSPCGTAISGRSTGIRVRSLRTPLLEAVTSIEREFAASGQDEFSFRRKMEEMTAGSLLVAARGMDRTDEAPLDERACLERGQFMSGSCAGLIHKIQDLHSFHRELAEGPLMLYKPFEGSTLDKSEPLPDKSSKSETPSSRISHGSKAHSMRGDIHERIAITGMSILNALGKSPEEVWDASLAMKSGITLIPKSRWDHDLFYDPKPLVPDKTYCKVGAFLDLNISRNELGISPQDFRTMTDATKITLWLADKAIRASGILESDIPRERIGVVISQNSGEAAGSLTNIIIRANIHDIISSIKKAITLTPDQEIAIVREIRAGRMAPDDTTLLGRLNCAAAGFVCNRYGFMGPSHSVSAACSTSLVALHSAIQMIRNGIIDAAIVGGGEDTLTHLHFLEFSALGALFSLSGQNRPAHETSRPFDAGRDGLVLGEGGGLIVIERESAARARGALVHAVITGMGASNNNLGMVESSHTTQEIAIRSSFRELPYGPDAVDLVECHATSTRQGDVQEVRALKTFFNSSKRTVLTSFKSQIGHTLGASGINNLIRGVMALQAGVFPPTLNYEHPDPEMGLEGSGLYIAPEPSDWKCNGGRPRRLQVNAFGFGGTNYVAHVEQSMDKADTVLVSPGRRTGPTGENREGPPALQGVSFFRSEMEDRNWRLAVVSQSQEEALTLIEGSASLLDAEVVSPKVTRSLARKRIFMGPEDVPALPLAFVFPGQGSQYESMGRDLYNSFPVIRDWMDRAAAVADFDLLHLLFNDSGENLRKTRWQQPAMFTIEHAMSRYLMSLGITPVAMAGHSLGELTALCLAGVYSPEDGFRIVNKRAICMDKAAGMNVDPGVMAATDAPLDLLKEMLQGPDAVHIGNINAPNQIVLSGGSEEVKDLVLKLKEKGYRSTLLRVSMAFHSPIMRVIRDELEEYVASIEFHPPQIPVISNTTMAPYPSDPGEIRRILMAHLESTVHWMDNVRTLSNEYGARLFVELGPGATLSNLIADTLPESLCIPTCLASAEGLTYRTALAQLFVQGHLKVQGEPRFVSLRAFRKTPDAHRIEAEPSASQPSKPGLAGSNPEESQDHLDVLIQIIMDATGFNRDEIEPDMDLRRDLSIRSSRLPVIMEAVERRFGITIEMKDFFDIHTVRDFAKKVTEIVSRHDGSSTRPAAKATEPGSARDETLKPSEDEVSLKRLVFDQVPVEPGVSLPIKLSPGESIILLSPDREDAIGRNAGEIFRQDYHAVTYTMEFMQKNPCPGEEGHDIRTNEGAAKAADAISGMSPVSGMIISLRQCGSVTDVSLLLRGLFSLLKTFLRSPAKKFVVLIHNRQDAETPSRLLAEAMLGLFLSAAQEYPSVQFRTAEIGPQSNLRTVLSSVLNKGLTVVETIHRDGKVLTSQGHIAPVLLKDLPNTNLKPGDVVVISGGATGISAHLARSLVPFAPRLVLLGRTPVPQDTDAFPAKPSPGPSPSEPFTSDKRASEIAQTLMDLHSSGIEATYYTCDVTDSEAVRATIGKVVSRYGKIDGIVHGAGILRDGLLSEMTEDDFSLVTHVKFLGAWNLFSASQEAGLKFFIGLSSVAAIQGNPGQANYASANRMMSGLLRYLHRKNPAIEFKALMLPPVEGAGMAQDPEVREFLKWKGVDYIHVNELAGLFCREITIAPADDDWVMFMRRLPSVNTALLDDAIRPSVKGELDEGTATFSPEDFPMIDGLSCLDVRREYLEAFRSFSLEKDLWIADHMPFKFMKDPLVSAAMLVETFMEAARILYPHLQVRGVRGIRFIDTIRCTPWLPRLTRISCRRADASLGEVSCEISLAIQEHSVSGGLPSRLIPYCIGQVILDGGKEYLGNGFPDFPVRMEELRTKPMGHNKILKWYKEFSGLTGRYRVMESIDGACSGVVKGRTVYRETSDFKHLQNTRYQYSPYLFEALLQLANFSNIAMIPSQRRSMIPMEIGEMRFFRKCRDGEQIILEARMRKQDEKSLTWDARGIDDQGKTIMQVHGMRMHLVSP